MACGSENCNASAHAVTGDAELLGVNHNLALTQSHSCEDLQRSLEVVGQPTMVSDDTILSVGGGYRNAPGSEVTQCCVVVLNGSAPVVRKGNTGYAIALGGGVDLARQADEGQVALHDAVRSTLGQVCSQSFKIFTHGG